MYFVTDIKLVDMQSNSYRHLDSYNNKAKLRGDLLLSLYDDKSDTMTSMTVAYRELNYFFRNAFKRYKILLPSKDFISITKHIALLPLLDYIDDYLGVVCQSMHYYMQLNNLFDIILSGELDLQDVSSMYSRIDDRITVIYSGYMHKGYRYKYEYKVTDLDKFQLLLTKISIRYSKFF